MWSFAIKEHISTACSRDETYYQLATETLHTHHFKRHFALSIVFSVSNQSASFLRSTCL